MDPREVKSSRDRPTSVDLLPAWPSISWHLDLLANIREQPFTTEDVIRAYALLFVPFLEFEHPHDRAGWFRAGLDLAVDEVLEDPEEQIVARALLLHDSPSSPRQRRLMAIERLEEPPLSRRGTTERVAERIQERAFANLGRILTSEEFAFRFRDRFAGEVRSEPLKPKQSVGMLWLSYGRIEMPDRDHRRERRLMSLRLRSMLPGLRVIALPFRWPSDAAPSPENYPQVHVFSPGHSFLGIRPDPRLNDKGWFVAAFHIGRLGFNEETKLVYREDWSELEGKETSLGFLVGIQPLRTVHLSTQVPAERIGRVTGARWDANQPSPIRAGEVPIKVHTSSHRVTLRVRAPIANSRYAIEWD